MAQAKIMDLTVACQSFPDLPAHEIHRENLLGAIETIFAGNNEIVIIEGAEGMGKTTLLTQFVRNYPQHALSLFIRDTSRWTSAPELLLRDLSNQLQWVLAHRELWAQEDVNETTLGLNLYELRRRARRRGETYYFVIDGLDEVPEQVRDAILALLPFGNPPHFRFLLASAPDQLAMLLPPKSRGKPFQLPSFNLDETKKYLHDLTSTQDTINEIYHTCNGTPGYLATVRRVLESGTDEQTLLQRLPETLPELFRLEWERARVAKEQPLDLLLALLAYSPRSHALAELAHILGIEKAAIETLCQGIGFIQVDAQNEIPRFISTAFRTFAREQLRHLKEEVYDRLITDLQRAPESDVALADLPRYLEERKRFDDLLEYLSPDHFTQLLERHQSLVPLQQMASLGVEAAQQLERDGDLTRFSLQKAVMIELGKAVIWRSEVAAYMALDDYTAALALAQGTSLKEDRLHLLAVIVKAKRKQGLAAEPELVEQIHQLYQQIDHATLGERAVEIASDLLYVDPSLAIELVEQATASDTTEDARDWAFAKLSVAAYTAQSEHLQPEDTIERIRGHIGAALPRQFTTKLSLLTGDYSTTEIIAEVSKIENVRTRLELLSEWTLKNRERADAREVVEFALELAIQTIEYTPSARILRELASPLPFSTDVPALKRLVGIFDSQKGTIEQLGPAEEVIRLALLLAQAEGGYNLEAARNRLIDIYFSIEALEDLDTKTACLAWYVAALVDIDPQMEFERQEGLHTLMDEELKKSIERLLNVTADHYRATRRIIKALAKTRPDMGLQVSRQLNKELDRDLALGELVDSALHVAPRKVDLLLIERAISHFAIPQLRDVALLAFIEWLSTTATEDWETLLQRALPLMNRIKEMGDASHRARAYSLVYPVLIQHGAGRYDELAASFLESLELTWESIDLGWRKINTGFKLVENLAACSLDKARAFLRHIEQIRDSITIDASIPASTYVACLRLTVRAYSSLLPRRLIRQEDTELLANLINFVPSYGERVRLWTELVLHCHLNTQSHENKRLVDEHVKPLLRMIPNEDQYYRNWVTVIAAPALYYAHQQTALDQIAQLPQRDRDAAYAEICEFILTKHSSFEPHEHVPGTGYDLTYEEMIDICELLGKMEYDAMIYHFIEAVADTLVARRYRDRYSAQQRTAIASRLETVATTKFPTARHIQHEGYKIAAQAQVCRIRQANVQAWESLIRAAQAIPNLADQAYVLSLIASAMPTREASRRKQLLETAKALIGQIPITLDKVEHYRTFASRIQEIEPALCKECLQLSMKATAGNESRDMHATRRQIIDLAYRVDQQFAESLVELVDDDPARTRLKKRLEVLKLKNQMLTQMRSLSDLQVSAASAYAEAAWMLLGALHAGRIDTLHHEQIRLFLPIAANLPIRKSYPLLAWFIENAKKRLAHTDEARRYLRPLYDAMLIATELSAKMAARSLTGLKQGKDRAVRAANGTSQLIRAGERERALQFLKSWFEGKVRDYLKICDPYFGLEDLEVLQLLRSVNPNCQVQILTSRRHQEDSGVAQPWGEAYSAYWRTHISDQDPPNTEIFIVGTAPGGQLPVHDRWWLTSGCGLRCGTSFNGLGHGRDSEISLLSPEEAEVFELEVDQYLLRKKREHRGERLLYTISVL